MEPTQLGIGGSFSTKASLKLDNIRAPLNNIKVKIDTGCPISVIPLAKFKPLQSLCNELKEVDIKDNIEYVASYGVETGGEKHDKPVTFDEKMECPALKFKHSVSNFEIAGVKISNDYIFVNYNRKGNILIGMDILKDWDIHIGISKIYKKTIFLACPYNSLNEDYYKALEEHFEIATEIISSEYPD